MKYSQQNVARYYIPVSLHNALQIEFMPGIPTYFLFGASYMKLALKILHMNKKI
jgi:hypothetical protein